MTRKLTLLAIGLLITLSASMKVSAQMEHPKVQTPSGIIIGRTRDDIQTFLGIPYAAPPIGERRFLPPGPAPAWTGEFDGSEMGLACPSIGKSDALFPPEPWSEDCLTLNVWTPDASNGSRPVMVWIHGGSLTSGTTRYELYDGRNLAQRGDIVVVSIQYRLGLLGWMNVSEFGGEAYTSSGNNGLLDMITALRWIQENIEYFGGDPTNITVAGESAGAIGISALLNTPLAEGLFQQAIIQSASPTSMVTNEVSQALGRVVAEQANVNSLEGLQNLSVEEILNIQTDVLAKPDLSIGPVLDDIVFKNSLLESIDMGNRAVPILIGTNLNEFRLWMLYSNLLKRLPLDYYKPWLNAITGGRADEMFDIYRSEKPGYSDAEIGAELVTDAAARIPSIRLAEALSSQGQDVWMYLFTLQSNIEDGWLGSPHGAELGFMFNNLKAQVVSHMFDISADQDAYQTFAYTMQDAWINFIRQGNPNTDTLGEWSKYDADKRLTMILDFDSQLESDPMSVERVSWDGVTFDVGTPLDPLSYSGTKITLSVILAVVGMEKVLAIGGGIIIALFGIYKWLRKRRNR